jgi:hypothetical protein
MTRLNRTLTRTALTASTLALAGVAVASLAAPAASAAPAAPLSSAAPASIPDQFLYPQSGHVYVDPTMAQALSAVPVGATAGSAGDALVTTSGPSMTVAVLSTVQHVIDGPVRQAAGIDAGVDVSWQTGPGGMVFNQTEIR